MDVTVGDNDPLALRRAQFRDAVRRGDALATARAAARLRAYVGDLGAGDLERLRAARQMLGRAIREARARRLFTPVPLEPAQAILLRRPRRLPYALGASIAVLALVLGGVLAPLLLDQPDETDAGGGGAPAVASDTAIAVTAQSRGRVVLADVAVVSATAEPQPTSAREASDPASPAPASGAGAAVGSAAPSGSGGPGSGTGGGSGSGTGSPRPAPTASRTPAPTNAICLSSVPRGLARLCGSVLDARTGRGIAGACVSLGPCTDQSARTDPAGRWTFTLPVGNGTLQWDLQFAATGYRTSTYTQISRQGRISIPTQRLAVAP